MVITFSATPNLGDWLYAAIMVEASNTLNIPVGWAELGQAATSSGVADNRTYVLSHQMNVTDTASFTFTSASGSITLGWMADVSGVAGSLVQFNIADETAEGFNVLSAPITPYLPNSLVLGMVGIRNGFYVSTGTGWTIIDSVFNFGSQFAVVSGPPTTTDPILANITTSDLSVVAMLILPPVLGSSGSVGITEINSQPGPFISVVGSPFIGISTTPNQLQVVNTGIQSVTGPSLTVSDTNIQIIGPAVLQNGSQFFISVGGSAGGGGGGGGGATPVSNYDALIVATPGIRDYWKLNETTGTTINDSAGPNSGSYNGTFALGVPMIGGFTGAWFNGTTGFGIIPTGGNLAGTAPQSISFLFMETGNSGTATAECMVTFNSASNAFETFIQDTDSLVAGKGINVGFAGGAANFMDWLVADGVYTHICLTYDGTNAKTYINGILLSTVAAATLGTSTGFLFACLRNGTTTGLNFYAGVLSRVAYFSGALTASTVATQAGTFLA